MVILKLKIMKALEKSDNRYIEEKKCRQWKNVIYKRNSLKARNVKIVQQYYSRCADCELITGIIS